MGFNSVFKGLKWEHAYFSRRLEIPFCSVQVILCTGQRKNRHNVCEFKSARFLLHCIYTVIVSSFNIGNKRRDNREPVAGRKCGMEVAGGSSGWRKAVWNGGGFAQQDKGKENLCWFSSFADPILVSCVNLQLSVYYIVELPLLGDNATDVSSYSVLPLCQHDGCIFR